jgi:hypothetical protein
MEMATPFKFPLSLTAKVEALKNNPPLPLPPRERVGVRVTAFPPLLLKERTGRE